MLGLNGEPVLLVFPALPGAPAVPGHVFAGAPGWPVVGLTVGVFGVWLAHAAAGTPIAKPTEQASASRYLRILSSCIQGCGGARLRPTANVNRVLVWQYIVQGPVLNHGG